MLKRDADKDRKICTAQGKTKENNEEKTRLFLKVRCFEWL